MTQETNVFVFPSQVGFVTFISNLDQVAIMIMKVL